jgi:hypothetical protein
MKDYFQDLDKQTTIETEEKDSISHARGEEISDPTYTEGK